MVSLQDINNAPSFSLAKTGHWTNLARTLQARDKSRIALRAHQPIHSIKNESSRILFYSMNWLGKIKQALTIYKEDIRNRLEEYNPEK